MKQRLYMFLTLLAFAANNTTASAGLCNGSTQAVVSSAGAVVGANDYYPFGKLWEGYGLPAPQTRYLFGGKEQQIVGGVNYMDFGSRMYDDFLGRWFTHDPQSYKRPWESPYAYCGGNPVCRIDPDGEFWLFTALIGGAINWIATVTTTGNWGIKSFLVGAATSLIGAGVGSFATTTLKIAGIGSNILGGIASGAVGSALSGGDIAQGMFFGYLGSLTGGAIGSLVKDQGFFRQLGTSTFSGGLISGGFSALQGGNFWESFKSGAIGAAAGFLGNELGKYVNGLREERKFMKEKLGLTKEQIKILKQYALGVIRNSDPHWGGQEFWDELIAKHSEFEVPFGKLRTLDYKGPNGEQLSIKVGKMHIRFGMADSEMAAKGYQMGKIKGTDIDYTGSIRVHYDRFDVIRFPLLHWIFDTKYQQRFHGVN